MRIVYIIGKYLTLPGAFLRAFWEQLTCLLLGIPVENTGYLRADEMCGHIEHILPKKPAAAYTLVKEQNITMTVIKRKL